ncbi:MAG: DUF1858 domain-containing protein [Evtepia sp.]|nr:DUF1858 domain-containing protein [Evtepia sp.]
MATITKDTIVGDILDIAPETAPAFIDIGMHCLGCPASRNETVEQACLVHDQPVEDLVRSSTPSSQPTGSKTERGAGNRSPFL